MVWHRLYIIIFAGVLFIQLPVLWFGWLFLSQHGELMPLEQVVKTQLQGSGNVLYSTGIHNDEFHHRMALVEAVHPAIVATGSSRACMLEKQFFTSSFINTCRAMVSVNSAWHVADRLVSMTSPIPKAVIVMADFWWFNSRYRLPTAVGAAPPQEERITIKKLVKPFVWLRQNKISLSEWLHWPWWRSKDTVTSPHIGPAAIKYGDGIRPDGSLVYTSLAVGDKPSMDVRFSRTIKSMTERRQEILQSAQVADTIYLDRFASAIKLMKESGISVLVALAPVAPMVREEIDRKNPDFLYIDTISTELASRGIIVYDYMKKENGLGTDCEYKDGTHGGSVVYARMLLDLLKNEPNILSSHVDSSALHRLVSDYKGRAQFDTEFMKGRDEIDFLRLGCDKSKKPSI